MTVPNWRHNSGKPPKRKLKPQALRQAKARVKSFKKRFVGRFKNDLFNVNPNLEVKEMDLLGSPIWYADDFYQYPDQVADYLFDRDVPLWKKELKLSYNNVYFEDRRLEEEDKRISKVYDLLGNICEQFPADNRLITNMTLFVKHTFNDYKKCHWWPHIDTGYNGIVYFNEDGGTNLYSSENFEPPPFELEHYTCWQPKERFKVLKTLPSAYNRMYLFDGCKFPHGMTFSTDRFFTEYRCNQVFFFRPVK